MGAHAISVADVDNDGKDEIIYHSMVVDDDGTGLFTTGLRHGRRIARPDLDPARPGMEVFGVHESEGSTIALYDGQGRRCMMPAPERFFGGNNPGVDVGRGLLCGYRSELSSGRNVGELPAGPASPTPVHSIYTQTPSATNFAIWWDADLSRETRGPDLDYKVESCYPHNEHTLLSRRERFNNGTKATPSLTADLLGDWREEVVWVAGCGQ
jgi:rhamnogalacturonan endolyase